MPFRSVEESRQTALRALQDAKRFQLQGNTHPKFCGLKLEDQQKIFDSMIAMRALVTASQAHSLGLDKSMDQFDQTIKWAKGTGCGNCGENASLALDYIANNEPEASAEIYQLDPAVDHVFCVVDRDKNSDPNKPETWGQNAFVCDPWADQVYSASALAEKKPYTFTNTNERPTAEAPVKEKHVIFDPSLHKIEPQKKLDTDTIRAIKSKQNVDHVLDAYKKKSEIILSALDTLSKDLEKEAKRLDKDKSSIGTEKTKVISEKMAAVQDEIARIKDDVKENIPNRHDYAAARAQLEGKLQTAVVNANKLTQLDAAHEQTLNKQKNPMLDKLVGKAAPKSAMAIQEAMAKARNTLSALNNQVAPQAAMEASPQPAPPASVRERQADPVSQPTPNMPEHAAAVPIPAGQLNNQSQMHQPAPQASSANEPMADNNPSPVAMSPPPDSAAPEQLHDAPVNEKVPNDTPYKAPTPEPSEQATSEESVDVPSDESNAQFSEAPEPEPEPEPVEMSAAPDSASGDEYQFPDTPDYEPGLDLPDVPDEEPGEASQSSSENKEKESARNDPIPS